MKFRRPRKLKKKMRANRATLKELSKCFNMLSKFNRKNV